VLVPLQLQGANLELEVLALDPTLTRYKHEPLQVAKVHPLEKGLV
jgi:hypothetical protein